MRLKNRPCYVSGPDASTTNAKGKLDNLQLVMMTEHCKLQYFGMKYHHSARRRTWVHWRFATIKMPRDISTVARRNHAWRNGQNYQKTKTTSDESARIVMSAGDELPWLLTDIKPGWITTSVTKTYQRSFKQLTTKSTLIIQNEQSYELQKDNDKTPTAAIVLLTSETKWQDGVRKATKT